MRILTATCYPNYGGSTKVLLAAAEALKPFHDVAIRAPFDGVTSRSLLTMPSSLSTMWQKIASLPVFARILYAEFEYVSTQRPDVVYVHDTPSLYVYGAVARSLRIPLVWHVHGEESGAIGRTVKNRCCDARICVARFLRQGGSPRREFVVPNPVNAPEGVLRVRTERKKLYMAASICDRKNQLLGIQIADELARRGHNVTLHLCGKVIEDSYLDEVKAAISRAGMSDRVFVRGLVPPERIYQDADVVLIPSKYEALPLVFLEALASGVPVVASRIPAHLEIAETIDLPTAFLSTALSPAAFADAIEALDPTDAIRLADIVRSEFSMQRFSNSLNEVFQSIDKHVAGGAGWDS